jgi:hypothetical protein
MPNLKVESTKTGIAIFREGGRTPILQHHAETDKRAYIHPIVAPDGNGILTEDTPPHHPWQHGLYVGLNDVNGIGFWMEGLHEKHKATDGTFHPRPITSISAHQNRASWTVLSDWKSPDGQPILIETQVWTLTDLGTIYHIDITWTLTAAIDLTFGPYAYGGLFLRMPYKKEMGGEAINSEGQINNQAEGQRARWVSVSMPIEGRSDWAGIAMCDHPTNPEYPNPWRVDGQLGIVPSRCIAGPWILKQQASSTNRYRLFVFTGRTDSTVVETQCQRFAE